MAKGKGNVKGLYLEIGGDADGLKTALSDVNKSIAQTSGELKGINRLLKLDPKNTELLAQKQEVLNENIAATESKLQTLKNAKEKCDADMANGTEVNAAQYRDLQREIIYTENRLKSLTDEQNANNSVIEKISKNLKDAGDKIDGVGKKLMPVTAGITALGAASVAAFNEVDEGYDTIVTKTGATGDALEGLQDSMNDVFGSMPTDAAAAGVAIGEVNTRFGATGETLEELSKRFIEFSTINETDLNNSIGMTNKIMKAWNIDSEQTSSVLGLITTKAQETGISVDTLMNSTLESNAVFKEMGLTFEQSIVLMSEFEKNGVNSSTAITGLRKAVANYTKQGLTMEQGLEKTIEKIKNAKTETAALQEAQAIFGNKGAAEMTNAIREGRLSIEELSASMTDYATTVTDTFNATLDPPDQAKVALNNLKLAGADLGNTLLSAVAPILEQLVGKLQSLAQWFSNLDENQKTMIITIAGIVAAIGPALIIIGNIATGVSTVISVLKTLSSVFTVVKTGFTIVKTAAMAFNAVLAANPIGLIITLVVAIGAALVTLYQKCEWFRNGVNSIVNFIKTNWKELATILINPFVGLFNLLYKLNPKFRQWVDNTVNSIKNGFNKMFEVGGHIITGLWNGISDKVEWLKSKVRGVVDKIKSWFTGKEGFDEHSPSKWAQKVGDFVMEGLANGVNENMSAEEAFKTKISNIKEFVTSNLSDIEAEYIQKQQSFAGKLKTADLYSKTSITFSGFGVDGGDETIEDIELTDWNKPIAEMAAYADKLLALENRLQTTDIDDGIRDDFLELVRNMGYEGQDYIDKLLSVDTGKFDEYMQGYQIYQKEAELAASATYAKEAQRLEDDFLGTVTGSLDTIVQKFGEGGKNSAQEFGSKFNAEMDSIMSEINRRISSIRATINDARTSLNSMARNYTTNNNNSRNYSVTINNKGGSNSSAYEQHRQVNKLFNKLDLEGAL